MNTICVYDTTFGVRSHALACFVVLTDAYPNRDVVLVTKKYKRSRGQKIYSLYSIWGLMLVLFCRDQAYIVSAPTFIDLKYKNSVQFWHGTPMKAMGKFDKTMSTKTLERMTTQFQNYNEIFVADEITKNSLMSGFNIKNNIIVADTPYRIYLKNLFNEQRIGNGNELICEILYAPTFRTNSNREWDLALDTDWKTFINKSSLKFVSIYHPSDPKSSFNPNEEILKKLVKCSLFVTDYSGLYFDALALGIPAFLYQSDILEYKKDRGFDDDAITDVEIHYDVQKLIATINHYHKNKVHEVQTDVDFNYQEALLEFKNHLQIFNNL